MKEEKKHYSNGFCRISKFFEVKGVAILVKVGEMFKRFVETSFK